MQRRTIVGTVLALALAAGMARAEDSVEQNIVKPATTVAADVRLADKYLASRGFVPEPKPSLQCGMYLNHTAVWGSLQGSTWVSAPLEGEGITEGDLGVSYHRDIGKQQNVHIAAGWNAYYLPDPDLRLQEVWGSIGLNNSLKPSITFYHDYSRDGNGQYAELAVQPTVGIGDHKLDVTAALMYNSEYFVERAGISGIRLKLQYPLYEGKRWALDADARSFHALSEQQVDHYNIGITLRLKGSK
ncbi:MAG TPA: hypothetical protein VJK52_00140 [Candidatus Nanoarchaeia archaeon]|nr:hypothetical protein [Candidatus Nanoarchaeia archaeon]